MFEYDQEKSLSNHQKHGIDFDEAQNIWGDEYRLSIKAGTTDEERFLMFARYQGKHWTAVYTMRGDDIRIISVRRSRKKEIEIYEG